jgi:hypothetical protein
VDSVSVSTQPPARLASEDVIISAPMSYAGSAQRIFRLRRRARDGRSLAAITVAAVLLTTVAWTLVTAWYLLWWGVLLVPYRLLRRAARKRRVEALRHRELLGTIQGAAAASAAAIVAAQARQALEAGAAGAPRPQLRIDAHERELAVGRLNEQYVAGRLTADELSERLTQAYAARTRGDLDGVLGDLPPPPA